jgi:SAM-dependent methyltransferase
MAGQPFRDFYMRVNQAVWKRLPSALRDTRLLRWHGTLLHDMVCRHRKRQQYFGTFFLRNRPELELIRRLTDLKPPDGEVRIAVLGCSIGAEIYSVLWTIRSARPDLKLRVWAVDISPEILDVAATATYSDETSGLVGSSIFERLTNGELQELFDWNGRTATVKPWIRAGINWHCGDAGDPGLIAILGPQDLVLASNFLCHMEPAAAEKCLRNIAKLVTRGGYLFVTGVDLDVRFKVAKDLRWEPVPELIREIHDGDPIVRRDWPWEWWGLEPLDDKKRDWQLRYATAYRRSASD